MRKIYLIFLLIQTALQLKAAVFIVTSNANAGAGTLREAILLANANGTAITDNINFNLSGSTASDVTIALESELPQLTSNIIIDGTTQPFSLLGNPNIRISLIRIVNDYFNGLTISGATRVEIYGISFSNFRADPQGTLDDKKGGVFISDSSNIIIGAPNKPNCFGNCYAGILSPYVFPRVDIEEIKISSNIFGLGENGLSSIPNETAIDVSFLKNSVIGGNTPEEGNLIASNTRNGIAVGAADGTINISNNIIGLDKNFNVKPSPAANGIYLNGTSSVPVISDNTIGGQLKGIWIDYVNGGFNIIRNRIGTGISGLENFSNGTGIHVNFSNTKSVIGGLTTNQTNVIAYNKVAILIENSYPVSILKNSIYCNSDGAITFKNQTAEPARISLITATEVSGVYKPNALVELFYTDECADCQGKTWFATINTDGAGSWSYTGNITGKVTSLGTDGNGATSNFSKPEINADAVSRQDVFCGENTGSIEGIVVYNASVFRWYNAAGVLISQEKVLKNVGAGNYYLKAGQLGACDVQSAIFTIKENGSGFDDKNKKIVNAKCGLSNGSISDIAVANQLSKTWYTDAGIQVSTGDNLLDVPAGGYYFKAGTGSCEITSNTYQIINEDKKYLVSLFDMAKSSCGNQNGGIQIKAYQGDTPLFFTWLNEEGTEISNLENLENVFPGVYTLIASNGEGCSNEAGRFTVEETVLPVIDLTKMQTFTSCDGKTISIAGVDIVGSTQPFHYQWADVNNNVVSEELMFKQILPGSYRLLLTDRYGCEVRSDLINFNNQKKEVLKAPNSFTPNGDGINDTWHIEGAQNYPNAEFFVLNRTGDRLFYSKGYPKAFDGTFNGKPLPVGVYYYLIDLKDDCGKLSGSLTILK